MKKLTTQILMLLSLTLLSLQVFAQNGLTIPTAHKRIWWNADTARINKAKRFLARNPDYKFSYWYGTYDWQLQYVLTGNKTYARNAINYYIKEFPSADKPYQNPGQELIRWYGETALLTYDWCYDEMTAVERDTFTARWNRWTDENNKVLWGGVGMEESNYYQGYMRNNIEWGMASYHQNPRAQDFLNEGLVKRWQNSYVPWANTKGRGGVPAEGTQYGFYQMNYPILFLGTASAMGRNLLRENPFFKESVFYLIYSTSQVPMYTRTPTVTPYYQIYQFNDDEQGPFTAASSNGYGNVASLVANEWKNVLLGQYASKWIKKVNCERDFLMRAFEEDVKDIDLATLPLDYYAPGFKNYYVNSSWKSNATSALFQLGYYVTDQHHQYDWGSFQIRRGNRWLTCETSGYGDQDLSKGFRGRFLNYSHSPINHNTVVFTGRGWTIGHAGGYHLGENKVLRLESQPGYSYSAVDLSGVYQIDESESEYKKELPYSDEILPRDSNPFAKTVIREFIFLRDLETTVILDRLESKDDPKWGKLIHSNSYGTATFPAKDVVKSFLLHSLTNPAVIDGQNIRITNGDHELKMTTLVPSAPKYTIVDDGDFTLETKGPEGQKRAYPADYQYRIEVSDSGTVQSYFLHVLQAKGKEEQDLTAVLNETEDQFIINLIHPAKGNARIILQKGMTSTGGQIGVSATGTPAMYKLTETIATIGVTDNGPEWGVNPPEGIPYTKKPQIITFNALPAKKVNDVPFTLSASTDSKLPLTFTSSDATIATISGNTVTIKKAGKVTIIASQAGNAEWEAASARQTLTINKQSQIITFGKLPDKKVGDAAFDLTATATSKLNITYTIDKTDVASISGTRVTIHKAGTVSITASQAGDNNWNAAEPVKQTLTISKKDQTITFEALPDKKVSDAPFDLSATASSSLAVTYTTDKTDIVSLTGTKVTILKAGSVNITASQAGDNTWNPAEPVTRTLTISKKTQTITFDALPDKKVGDAPFDLSATASSSLVVTYKSDKPEIASITGAKVTVLKSGTATITASQAGNEEWEAASASQKLTITSTTGINEQEEDKLSIYPNPVTENLYIKGKGFENTNASIFNALGANVWSGKVAGQSINVSQLPAGIYLLKTSNKNEVKTIRFEKQ